MQFASFGDFWIALLIFLGIFFALKWILRLFWPHIMRFVLRQIGKKVEKKFSNAADFSGGDEPAKTTISHKPPNKRQSNNDVGEYIDYEEID